jgi:hypothetical protein
MPVRRSPHGARGVRGLKKNFPDGTHVTRSDAIGLTAFPKGDLGHFGRPYGTENGHARLYEAAVDLVSVFPPKCRGMMLRAELFLCLAVQAGEVVA